MTTRAVLVDCYNEVIRSVELCGRAHLIPVHPKRKTQLDTSKPHRSDLVARVFVLEGKSAYGEWIYRETHWDFFPCDCKDGWL